MAEMAPAEAGKEAGMDQAEVKTKVLTLLTQPHLVVVFSTVDEKSRPQSRLMGAMVPVPHEDFSWYMETAHESRKVEQIRKNPHGQVLAFNHDYTEVATLSGKVALVEDADVKKYVWDAVPGSAEYFSDWKSPDFGILKFTVKNLEYLNLTMQLEPFSIKV
jgi:general stress protein 26